LDILSDSEGVGTKGIFESRQDRMKRTMQLRDAARLVGVPKDHVVVFSTDQADCGQLHTDIQDCGPFQFTGAQASFTKLQQEILKLPKGSRLFLVMEVHGMHQAKKKDALALVGNQKVIKPQKPYLSGGCLSMSHEVLQTVMNPTSAANEWCSNDFHSFIDEVQDRIELILCQSVKRK